MDISVVVFTFCHNSTLVLSSSMEHLIVLRSGVQHPLRRSLSPLCTPKRTVCGSKCVFVSEFIRRRATFIYVCTHRCVHNQQQKKLSYEASPWSINLSFPACIGNLIFSSIWKEKCSFYTLVGKMFISLRLIATVTITWLYANTFPSIGLCFYSIHCLLLTFLSATSLFRSRCTVLCCSFIGIGAFVHS